MWLHLSRSSYNGDQGFAVGVRVGVPGVVARSQESELVRTPESEPEQHHNDSEILADSDAAFTPAYERKTQLDLVLLITHAELTFNNRTFR